MCGATLGSMLVALRVQVREFVRAVGERRCEMWIGDGVKRKLRTHFLDRMSRIGLRERTVGSGGETPRGARQASVCISFGDGCGCVVIS